MSVYLDNASGKFFNTLSELKAFQRQRENQGEVKTSPSFLPEQNTNSEKEVEKLENPEIEEDVEDIQETQEGDIRYPSRNKMVEKLKDMGFDGRTVRKDTSIEDIKFMYRTHILEL